MSEKQRCEATFHYRNGTRFGGRKQCSRNAKVERYGKHYCGQHDPVAVEARSEASWQRCNEEAKALADRARIEAAAPKLLAACENALRAFSDAGLDHLVVTDELETAIREARGKS